MLCAAKLEQVNKPQGRHFVEPAPVTSPLPGQDRQQPLEQYLAIAKNHRHYRTKNGKGREIVGVNNIGEITFELIDGKQIAVQTLWWRLESWENGKLLEPFPLTRYEVSLLFDDDRHPMNHVLKEVQDYNSGL